MKRFFFSIFFLVVINCLNSQHLHIVEEGTTNIKAINENKTVTDIVRPQDDIYLHVNGQWMKTAEIPADRSRWGSFDQLREFTDTLTVNLVNELIKKEYTKGSDEQKIKDFYQCIMNWKVRNSLGLYPLQPYFNKIDKIQSKADLLQYLIDMSMEERDPFIGIWVGNHMKRSNENAVYLGNLELGVGRDYYQKHDEKSKEVLKQFEAYINQLSHIVQPEVKGNFGKQYVDFEKEVAQYLLTIEDIRNSELQYNPIAVKEFNKKVSTFPIEFYLKQQNYHVDTVIISEIKYFNNFDKFINEDNIGFLRKYLKVHLLNSCMTVLSKDLDSIHFEFYGKKLSGQKIQRSDEKRALNVINQTFGEILGKVYVKRAFSPEAKQTAVEMVEYLKKSFKIHIENLSWMSTTTKTRALDKLSKIMVKIGYPDKWKDYSNVEVNSILDGGNYFSNLREYYIWNQIEQLNKIGKPVDRTEWGMSPQTVNAYYNPMNNEIVFPAAILQPPFFDAKASPAVNFGGIGAVIGHEISHGFDDGGCQYDGDGNLSNWWTDEDKSKFEKATSALVDQYNRYEPLPGVFVNGKFTLGENIADLGGVSVAFDAMKMYIRDFPAKAKYKASTSPDEDFFMSWATIWRNKIRDKALMNMVKTDPHSPGYYRAIGPLVNVEAFYQTFNLQPSDKMYKQPEQRILIW